MLITQIKNTDLRPGTNYTYAGVYIEPLWAKLLKAKS